MSADEHCFNVFGVKLACTLHIVEQDSTFYCLPVINYLWQFRRFTIIFCNLLFLYDQTTKFVRLGYFTWHEYYLIMRRSLHSMLHPSICPSRASDFLETDKQQRFIILWKHSPGQEK